MAAGGCGSRIRWECRVSRRSVTTLFVASRWVTPSANPPCENALRHVLALIRALQAFNIELDHAEHRLHGALRAGGIRTTEIFWQRSRHDLPRHAVTVLQPATLVGFAAVRE